MEEIFYYKSKFGIIKGIIRDNKLIFFKNINSKINVQISDINKSKLVLKIENQLDEYFNGKRRIFNIPLQLEGSEFQKKVWEALLKIPYGETKSYKEIAKIIGNEKAYRAVGMANNRNPITIIVPCHRVIGSNNKLIGYFGGLKMKESLLKMEKKGIC